jgi:hypothetical protein
MKQTKEILDQLKNEFNNIEYYNVIVKTIEENVNTNPDIAIESCKSLFEGIGKFIILSLDNSLSFDVVEKFKYKRAIAKAIELLEKRHLEFESDFSNKLIDTLEVIGNIRNDRGDVSHGRLSPKPIHSTSIFSNCIMTLTDSFVSYLLISFSKVELIKKMEYEDNPEFNEWLDENNQFGLLKSYSKALFEQDKVAYEQELIDYLELQASNNVKAD